MTFSGLPPGFDYQGTNKKVLIQQAFFFFFQYENSSKSIMQIHLCRAEANCFAEVCTHSSLSFACNNLRFQHALHTIITLINRCQSPYSITPLWEWVYAYNSNVCIKKSQCVCVCKVLDCTSNKAMFFPSYCWLFSAAASLLLMKGLLSLGLLSPEEKKTHKHWF